MFFRDAESYNRSILREEKQGGRKDEIKKIMALLLVGCMAASLAACGSGEGKKNAKRVETDR